MEGKINPDGLLVVSSEIDLKDYFSRYNNLVNETFLAYDNDTWPTTWNKHTPTPLPKLAQMMNVDIGFCKMLATKCRLTLLDSTERTKKGKVPPPNSNQKLEKASQFLESARIQKQLILQPSKYHRRLREMKRHFLPDIKCDEGSSDSIKWQPGDFEVTVRVYRPHRASQAMKTVYPSNDIWVHSSQTLAELKDTITCANNDILVGDIYSMTSEAEVVDAKNLVKSGVFLFGDTFYTDLRVVNNERYGEEIQKWMANQPDYSAMKFNQATTEAKINSLVIRFGWPYVFIHLQRCEHLVRFISARLIINRNAAVTYPVVVQAPPSPIYCDACQTHLSQWVVSDRLLPKKYMFFCQSCFRSFYYFNGKKTERPFESHLFPQQAFPEQIAEPKEGDDEMST